MLTSTPNLSRTKMSAAALFEKYNDLLHLIERAPPSSKTLIKK